MFIQEMFNPSIYILLSLVSRIRNKTSLSELFPAPVFALTPTLSPALIVNELPSNTDARSSA